MLKILSKKRAQWLVGTALCGLSFILAGALMSCVQTRQRIEKAPSKTCQDCHPQMAERFNQGYIHKPVREGRCDLCHLPHGLIGVVILREDEPGVCYACHKDMQPASENQSVHKPVSDGKCNSCHNPHNSKYPFLLKAAGDENCFSCHDQSAFNRKVMHAPLGQGCSTCHDPHKSKNERLLIKDYDTLCLSCHNADTNDFITAHTQYPVKSGCLQCHTQHSGERPMLLKDTLHKPIEQGKCSLCHEVRNEAVATLESADTLCFKCHERPATDRASSHVPYQNEQCTTCHLVHASDDPLLLSDTMDKICLACHEKGKKETAQGPMEGYPHEGKPPEDSDKIVSSIHQPVKDGKCLSCHNGHDSNLKTLLKQDSRTLCYNCHDKTLLSDNSISHPVDPQQSCGTCHKPHESAHKYLLLNDQEALCFSCHKKKADERGRLSLHQPFAVGNCTGCHGLHGAAAEHYLKKNNKNGVLCAECHTKIQNTDDSIKPHQPVANGQCEECHASHSADYSFVVKDNPGKLCMGCHKDIQLLMQKAEILHSPVNDLDCTACHAAHGSPHENILKKGQPALCLICHKETAQYWQEGLAHQPAIKNCMSCHTPHGSNNQGMLNTEISKLCATCHKVTGDKFLESHQNIQPGVESCVTCHDAHGSPDKGLLFPVGHTPFQEGTCKPCHKGRAR